MNNNTRLIISLLIVLSMSTVSLGKEIVSKQLLDSQYGVIGDWLNVGDRFYKVTYDDGTSEEVIIAGGSPLSSAAITEYVSSGNVDSSKCYKAILQYRVKTILDSPNTYSTTHKIEVWRNDIEGSIDLLEREFPNWKVAYTPEFTASTTISVLQTIQVPYEPGYSGGRMEFDVVEYQQKLDGRWVRVLPGFATKTRASIMWWDTYQSGSGRGDLMPGCTGAPMPPIPSTPTPPTTVSVSSTPIGATVTAGGSVIGTTPFTLTLSSGESKILTFSKEGYVSQAKGVAAGTSSVSTTLLPIATPLPTQSPTPTGTPIPGTPVQTTIAGTPVQTVAGTPVQTYSEGSSTLETEPAADNGKAVVTYEEESLLSTTNILIALVVALGIFVAYTKLYVQKGKGKRRK